MEDREPKDIGIVITPKTPEQLQEQFNLIRTRSAVNPNAQHYLKEKHPKMPIDAREAVKYIKNERETYEDAKNKPGDVASVWKPRIISDFEIYIEMIRDLRREQRNKLSEVINEPSITELPSERFIKASQYSPETAKMLLLDLDKYSSPEEEFTDKDYQLALTSKEGLGEALQNGVIRKPFRLFSSSTKDIVLSNLSKEQIHDVLMQMEGNTNILFQFEMISQYLSPKEQKQLLASAFNNEKYKSGNALRLLLNENAASLFSSDEISQIIQTDATDSNKLHADELEKLYEKNILTPSEIETIVNSRIHTLKEIKGIEEIIDLLPGVTLEDLQNKVENAYRENREGLTITAKVSPLIHDEFLSLDRKKDVIKSLISKDPVSVLSYEWHYMHRVLDDEEIGLVLHTVINTAGLDHTFMSMSTIFDSTQLSLLDKEIFAKSMLESKHPYNRTSFLQVMSRYLYNFPPGRQREIIADFHSQIPAVEWMNYSETIRDESEETPEQIQLFIEENKHDKKFREACFKRMFSLAHRLPHDYLENFIVQNASTTPRAALESVAYFANILSVDKQEEVLRSILRVNPPLFLFTLAKEEELGETWGKDFTTDAVIDVALRDERINFAPKTLSDIYKKLQGTPDLLSKKALLKEGSTLYEQIAQISETQMESLFFTAQHASEKGITRAQEPELVAVFGCLAEIKMIDPESIKEIEATCVTLEGAKQQVFLLLSKHLGVEREVTTVDMERFFAVMDSPAPFMSYLLQYEHSPAHKEILQGMYEAILDGKYNDWKFCQDSEQSLEELKEKKLLPEYLTLEQYEIWRRDSQTTLHESLASNSQEVSSGIRNYLAGELHHLGLPQELYDLIQSREGTPSEILLIGELERTQIQQREESIRFGQVNAQIRELQSTPDSTVQIEQLRKESIALKDRRVSLARAIKVLRLMTITPSEINANALLEGEAGTRKGQSLSTILNDLEKTADEGDAHIWENIKEGLAVYRSQTGESQNLLCTDSSNPKVTLEIGENPVASCQSYNEGVVNECLLGYTDPKNKILALRNERGNIIARSIFRLLSDQNGQPALHIERIYSVNESVGITRCIYEQAYKKAQEMNVPLYVSEKSQDEQGVEQDMQVPEQFRLHITPTILHSRALRAPAEYVDSAGGGTTGIYEMKGIKQVLPRVA